MKKFKVPMSDVELIEAAGGTYTLARLCEIKPPSVSGWKKRNHIPKAQRKFLAKEIPNLPWLAKLEAQRG
jgi:hypothetical protein